MGNTSKLCERIFERLSYDYDDEEKGKFINELCNDLSQIPDKSPIKTALRALCNRIEELEV